MLQAVISDQRALKWESSAVERQHVSIIDDDSVVNLSPYKLTEHFFKLLVSKE